MAETKTEQIEEVPVKGKPLGRHIEHDPRSRAFAATPKKSTTIHTVRHTFYGHPLNQDLPKPVGSCTCSATCGALNTRGLHVPTSKLFNQEDALDLYSLTTSIDD